MPLLHRRDFRRVAVHEPRRRYHLPVLIRHTRNRVHLLFLDVLLVRDEVE